MTEAAEATITETPDPKSMTTKERCLYAAELIEQGGQTPDSMVEALQVKSARSLSSIFSMLQIRDQFVVKNDDGVYELLNLDEWNEHQSKADKAKAEKKTKKAGPKRDLKDLQLKRARKIAAIQKKGEARNRIEKKYLADPTSVSLSYQMQIATLQFSLAEHEYGKFNAKVVKDLNLSGMDQLNSIDDLDEYVLKLRADGLVE